MVHGYAEHSARYDHVVADWRGRGLTCARLDLRGHGRSEGARGHVNRFSDYVDDVIAFVSSLAGEPEWQGGRAPVVFGHSMGALLAAHVVLGMKNAVAGLALTSPFLGLAKPVPRVQHALGTFVARILPGLRQPSGLQGKDISHDPEIVARYDTDPLGFRHVTVRWFVEVERAQAALLRAAPQFDLPIFAIAAGDDRVVSLAAVRRFFETVSSREKELDVRPGLFHEVLNEPDWRDHTARLGERMLSWSLA